MNDTLPQWTSTKTWGDTCAPCQAWQGGSHPPACKPKIDGQLFICKQAEYNYQDAVKYLGKTQSTPGLVDQIPIAQDAVNQWDEIRRWTSMWDQHKRLNQLYK